MVYKRQGKGRLVMVFVTLNVNYYEILILINEMQLGQEHHLLRVELSLQLLKTQNLKERSTQKIKDNI